MRCTIHCAWWSWRLYPSSRPDAWILLSGLMLVFWLFLKRVAVASISDMFHGPKLIVLHVLLLGGFHEDLCQKSRAEARLVEGLLLRALSCLPSTIVQQSCTPKDHKLPRDGSIVCTLCKKKPADVQCVQCRTRRAEAAWEQLRALLEALEEESPPLLSNTRFFTKSERKRARERE